MFQSKIYKYRIKTITRKNGNIEHYVQSKEKYKPLYWLRVDGFSFFIFEIFLGIFFIWSKGGFPLTIEDAMSDMNRQIDYDNRRYNGQMESLKKKRQAKKDKREVKHQNKIVKTEIIRK